MHDVSIYIDVSGAASANKCYYIVYTGNSRRIMRSIPVCAPEIEKINECTIAKCGPVKRC